jgi:hypothetical protein
MLAGRFEDAWKVCDAVLAARNGAPTWRLPRHQQAIWNGQPLDRRRVLIRCYHGLGDTIQFIRFAPLVEAIAKEVIVWAQPALLPLLRTAEGIDHLIPLHDGVPDAEYDADVEIMELPHVFRTKIDTIPRQIPYLHARPTPSDRDERMQVGLFWKAGDWEPKRSMPFEVLAPLADVPGVRWHVLQQDAPAAGWDGSFGQLSGSDDLTELAGIMRSLDLVITVDSMPAHLAGALGVPAWTLLHAHPDWRWMADREDSPWYPTMRLLRQRRAGDWAGLIRRVASELTERNCGAGFSLRSARQAKACTTTH